MGRVRNLARERRYDKLRRVYDYRAQRDGTITRRKLQALHALGYSLTEIGRRIGREQQSVSDTLHSTGPVHWRTERAVARLYDELENTPLEGPYAHRTRLRARRLGYAPPAAYDDINDPHETPKGVLAP
jgi:hypothetical protein